MMASGILKDLLKTVKKAQEQGINTMPVEDMFLNDFNKCLVMVERDRAQGKPPKGYFRPSSLYGCERMLFLSQVHDIGDEEDADAPLIGINESGTDRHSRIQYVIGQMQSRGFDCECLDVEHEVELAQARGIKTRFLGWNDEHTEARCVNDDYRIYFQTDGILLYKGRRYILEIKTENTFKYNNRLCPKEEHLNFQTTSYSAGLGINNVLFIYEDRNFTKKKLYVETITDEMRAAIKNKVDRVLWYVQANQPPPMEQEKCMYCKFKKICAEIGETEAVHGV